jgi:hypothetical protein
MSQVAFQTATVLDRADPAQVVTDPFPYIVVRNALPDDYYQALSASFPSLEGLDPGLAGANNKRLNLMSSWGPTELGNERAPAVWKQFLADHTTPEYSRKVFDLFPMAVVEGAAPGERWIRTEALGEGLAEMLQLKGPVADTDILARATVAVNTPVTVPASVRGPHVDNRWKAYVGLFYVRRPGDDSEGGDLTIFRWKKGARPKPWTLQADPADVEEVTTIKYAPNTLVLLLNTHDSLHGVTVRQATPHVRQFVVASGWFPGVDESRLLGRRRGVVERLKGLVRPLLGRTTAQPDYQD